PPPPPAAVAGPPKAKPLPAQRVVERTLTDDQRVNFDKAVALYHQLKKSGSGSLKGDACEEAMDTFRPVGEPSPNMLEARHDQAAVALECGRRDEAVRIWEKLANGKRPYAPALASLGLEAWRRGDTSGAETLFTRAVDADKGMGSIAARINLAQ